jgi:hypothetical protein
MKNTLAVVVVFVVLFLLLCTCFYLIRSMTTRNKFIYFSSLKKMFVCSLKIFVCFRWLYCNILLQVKSTISPSHTHTYKATIYCLTWFKLVNTRAFQKCTQTNSLLMNHLRLALSRKVYTLLKTALLGNWNNSQMVYLFRQLHGIFYTLGHM